MCNNYTDILKNNFDNLALCIDIMANSDIQMRINENMDIIHHLVCAILFLRKQGLPFIVIMKISAKQKWDPVVWKVEVDSIKSITNWGRYKENTEQTEYMCIK